MVRKTQFAESDGPEWKGMNTSVLAVQVDCNFSLGEEFAERLHYFQFPRDSSADWVPFNLIYRYRYTTLFHQLYIYIYHSEYSKGQSQF